MIRDELCGRTIGELVLRERIGEGGFGAVYRCEQPLLGREAVVKVLQSGLRGSELVVERFRREAQLASRLDHPYAAHIYAFGVEADEGLMWIAMELVRGTTLDRWLRDRGPLRVDQLVPLFERIAEVVQTAHEHGIVHRDLKPSNVMVIERAGQLLPKLLDFGIAKLADDALPLRPAEHPLDGDITLDELPRPRRTSIPIERLTHAGATVGSPPYMAPEQWANASAVGPSADLYALAVMAYEAVAGRRPFDATTQSGLAELHRSSPVPPLGDGFAAALDRFFARALAKRPEERFGNGLVLAAALRVACGLGGSPHELPRLDEGVRDAWQAYAPQPLAEAVAALDSARNAHQARDAVRELFGGLVRYLLAIALAVRAQVRGPRDDAALAELLRELGSRAFSDGERVELLRALARPFAAHRGAHPLPGLVALAEGEAFDPVLARISSEPHAAEDVARGQLAELVPALGRLLRDASFVLDHPLVVARGALAERWTGVRRQRRLLASAHGPLAEHKPTLLDGEGHALVELWPLVQALPPATGAEPELFVLDGRGRRGARLVASPHGFEHADPEAWEWLAANVVGEPDADREAAADSRPPYLGLAAFSAADADRFVGREREVEAFANRLRRLPFQLVIGASGAGKSSFLHAGVIPALPAGWCAVAMRPGARPCATLAARLAAAESADVTVIVVDQLEELFTLCADPAERERFAARLAELGGSLDAPLRVVCAVRDDFLMAVEALAPLRPLLSPAVFLLGNPSRDDLVRTLVEPARRCGYKLSDDELATEMVDAVAEHPGALALLSFTGSRLWELRDRRFRQLTRRAYDAMGGIGGALGRHAEETFLAFTADDAALAREVFRHLVTADETRAVLTRSELRERLAHAHADAVIDKLVDARLVAVVEGDACVEIIHETLIGAWPRLQHWVREDAEGARMREQLRTAARQWHDRGRQRGLLWRHEILGELERWRRRSGAPLTELETAFADASRVAAARGRRLWRATSAIAFVVLAATALVMYQLRSQARAQAVEVKDKLVQSYIDQARTKLLDGRRWEALASIVAAEKLGAHGPVIETMRAIARAPARALQYRLIANHGRTWSVRYSRDGALLATAGEDGAALWDARTGALRFRLTGHAGGVRDAVFDPTAARVATIGFDGTLRLFEVATGWVAQVVHAHVGIARCVSWRPDGRWLATGGDDGKVKIWDPASGLEVLSIATERGAVATTCEFGAQLLAVGTFTGQVLLVDPDARSSVTLGHHDDWARSVQFAGDRLVTASSDQTVRIWDVTKRSELATLHGASDWLVTAAVSPDRKSIAAVGRDATVRLWDAETGALRFARTGHQGVVWFAEFSPDGSQLVTSADDGSARVWDARTGTPLAVLEGHSAAVLRAHFSPDGKQVVTSSYDGTVAAWDPRATYLIADATAARSSECGLDVSLDSRWATVACDDASTVWDVAQHRVVARLPGATFGAANAARALLASGTNARLVELPSGRTLADLPLAHPSNSLAGAPDRFAIGDASGATRVLALDGRERLAVTGSGPTSAIALLEGERWISVHAETLALHDGTRAVVTRRVDPTDQRIGGVLSPSGQRFALFGLKELWLYEQGGSPALVALAGHQAATMQAAFDRTGARMLSTGQDGTALLWDVASRRVVQRLVSRSQYLAGAVFDESGQLVIALDGSGALELFDAATGAPIATIDGRLVIPSALLAASDGAVLGFDSRGNALVWRIPRDTSPLAEVERDLACKAPPHQVVGTCQP